MSLYQIIRGRVWYEAMYVYFKWLFLSHPQSTFMCWPLKKKMVAGMRVMSKYWV